MKFSCMFKGGPYDGKGAEVQVEKFVVGSNLQFGNEIYKIGNGPIAQWMEKKQTGHENMMAVVEYVGPVVGNN